MGKKKVSKKKGKKDHKGKPTSKKYLKYKIEGDKIVRDKICPRCGPGVFLGKSKSDDRLHCGRCHYTEFAKKDGKKQEWRNRRGE